LEMSAAQQAADHGLGHVAAADEADGLVDVHPREATRNGRDLALHLWPGLQPHMRRNLLRLGRAAAFVVLVMGIAIALRLVWPDARAAGVYLAAVGCAAIVVAPIVYWLRPPDTAPLRRRIAELEAEL